MPSFPCLKAKRLLFVPRGVLLVPMFDERDNLVQTATVIMSNYLFIEPSLHSPSSSFRLFVQLSCVDADLSRSPFYLKILCRSHYRSRVRDFLFVTLQTDPECIMVFYGGKKNCQWFLLPASIWTAVDNINVSYPRVRNWGYIKRQIPSG